MRDKRSFWVVKGKKRGVPQRKERKKRRQLLLRKQRQRSNWRPNWGETVSSVRGRNLIVYVDGNEPREGQLEVQEEKTKARQRQAGFSVKSLKFLTGEAGSMDVRARLLFLSASVFSVTLAVSQHRGISCVAAPWLRVKVGSENCRAKDGGKQLVAVCPAGEAVGPGAGKRTVGEPST